MQVFSTVWSERSELSAKFVLRKSYFVILL